jgi:putative transposase
MRTGRPKAVLTMSSDERAHLLAITRSRSLPAALTLRAKIVLACEREPSNAVVATRLGVGPHTIGKGANASSPIGSRGSTMRCVPAGPVRSRMRPWPS